MFADDGYVSIHLFKYFLLLTFVVNALVLGWMFRTVRRSGWGTTRGERQQRIALVVTGSVFCVGLVIAGVYLLLTFS